MKFNSPESSMCLFARSLLNKHFPSTHYLLVPQVGPRDPEELIVQCGDRQGIVAM